LPIDLYDVRKFDAQLGASLEKLASAHRSWAAARWPAEPLLVDGTPIEDLCLSFVLPGT
jgi:E3 ubiquitin-protein ligase TRIP12